jgi:hypothetical protein
MAAAKACDLSRWRGAAPPRIAKHPLTMYVRTRVRYDCAAACTLSDARSCISASSCWELCPTLR